MPIRKISAANDLMTRRALFLFPAQAIQMLPSGDVVRQKPLNGHCPVCGEVAKIIETPREISMMKNCKSAGGNLVECDLPGYLPSQASIVRCSFCSSAFWQDSEPIK